MEQLEAWIDITDYEGLYRVSNMGRVVSIKRSGSKGGLLKPYYCRGYLAVILSKEGKHKSKKVHRLVAQHFIANHNNHLFVNHKDGRKENNAVENLEWCTREYNDWHRSNILGKSTEGIKNGNAKLSEDDIAAIRSAERRSVYGYTKRLALKYGTDAQVIRDIWNRKSWKHI